jgi:hypothetical protein
MTGFLVPFLGALIDRRDGDSGAKGAVVGTIVQKAIGASLPIVGTFALGWAVKRLALRSWSVIAGHAQDSRTPPTSRSSE